jgi:molecular chaperone Hsp33
VTFHCPCSTERVLESIATLPRADIEELLSSEEPLTMSCDYCNATYEVTTAQLRDLLDRSRVQ